MSGNDLVQADLRFLLPIEPKQQVAVLGHAPGLVMALSEAEAHCTIVLPEAQELDTPTVPNNQMRVISGKLPFSDGSLHHIFIPQLTANQVLWLPDEVARILKPGGWLFLGVRNRYSFHQLRSKKQTGIGLTLPYLKRLLSSPNWKINQCYGVHDDLQHPQYLIPLGTATAVNYFYQKIFMPNSTAGAWIQHLALYLNQIGGGHLLFKDLGITTQRI